MEKKPPEYLEVQEFHQFHTLLMNQTNIKNISISEFLNHHDTKDRLTRFFGGKLCEYFSDICVPYAVAYAGYCHSSNVENEVRNNHEEADTLIGRECMKCSYGVIDVFSPDTDVMVLLIGHCSKLKCKVNVICTSIINIDSVAEYLDEEKSSGLIGLHSVSGCDTTGKVYRKGKQTWVKAFLSSSNRFFEYACIKRVFRIINAWNRKTIYISILSTNENLKLYRMVDRTFLRKIMQIVKNYYQQLEYYCNM